MKKFLFVLSALSLAATASFAVEKATKKTEIHKKGKTHRMHPHNKKSHVSSNNTSLLDTEITKPQ